MEIISSLTNDTSNAINTAQSDFLKSVLDQASNTSKTTLPTGPNRNMGKDEFLKLLLTQLQYQDPTNPMDDRQFISEMAQFTSLEQMTSMNQSFTKYTESQTSVFENLTNTLQTLSASSQVNGLFSAIGKYVSMTEKSFSVRDGVVNTTSMFIPENTSATQIRIYDSNGSLTKAVDLGTVSKGEKQLWQWDGKTDSGTTASDGQYTVEVLQKDARGLYKPISSEVLGYVYGVTLNNPDGPRFRIGDSETVPVSAVQEVTI